MPPKILVNVPGYSARGPSGVPRVCFSLLQALVERGRFCYALRTEYAREELPSALRAAPIELINTPPLRRKFLDVFCQSISVPALARRIGASAILNMDHIGPALGGPPRAMIVHDVFPRALPAQYSLGSRCKFDVVYKIATRTTDALVAISETTARDLGRFYPAAREKTVVITLDTTLRSEAASEQRTPEIEPPYVLTVANGTPNKNLAAIGQAARLLDERGIAFRLVHVGSDPADTIRTAAGRRLDNVEIVRMIGVEEGTLAQLYRGAACYVNTSLYEGFCLPIVEAQKLACPVICSDRSATAEVGGEGAILCDPTDASSVAAAIMRVLCDGAFREAVRSAGTRNAARFSWAKSAAAFEALFEKLTGLPQ
jgi:glycosyltransferase involved in cell wall biosynthesis